MTGNQLGRGMVNRGIVHRPRDHRQRGVTLIELMVVMAILVLLSVISYRALVTALETRQVVDEYSEQLREFELGLFLLAKDLKQVQVSPLPEGTVPFSSDFGGYSTDDASEPATLFRLVRAPDAQLHQGIREVTYYLDGGTLWQRVRPIRPTAPDEPIFSTPLFNDLLSASVIFYDEKGNRLRRWQQPTPPDVVEINLSHRRYQTIQVRERINGR